MPTKRSVTETKSTKTAKPVKSARGAARVSAPKAGRKEAPARGAAEAGDEIEEFERTVLSRDNEILLEDSGTLLFQIQYYADRARLVGYDDNEHALGLRLHATAAGRNRPLSHWAAEGARTNEPIQYTAEQMRLLQDVDQFENIWFPRLRGIFQRVVPPEELPRFLEAFFTNLSQQPLGPGVLDSVPTMLDRFDALATSSLPGAKAAHALGVKRGLTDEKIEETRQLVASAREVLPKAAETPSPVSIAELKAAQQEQYAALAQLRRWYADWCQTFRTLFNTRILIRLGIASLKRTTDASDASKPADTGGEETKTVAGGEGGH